MIFVCEKENKLFIIKLILNLLGFWGVGGGMLLILLLKINQMEPLIS